MTDKLWTKKLDTLHRYDKPIPCVNASGVMGTNCGKAMLGNNYAKYFADREKCEVCWK